MELLHVPRIGGLVLTAKAEETHSWIAYAKACGKEKTLSSFKRRVGPNGPRRR